MRNNLGVLNANWTAGFTGVRAGGWVTGLDLADDDTLVARNDVNNQHVRSASDTKWTRIFRYGDNVTLSTFPDVGSWDVCIFPTNSSIIMAFYNGECWYTSDKAVTLTKRTAFTRDTTLDHNNSYRYYGARARFDPANAAVVAVMTTSGLKYTFDSGVTWNTVTTGAGGIPAPLVPYACITVNRAGTVTSGKSQEWVAVSPGNGIYRTTTGLAGTWSLIASAPATAKNWTDAKFDRAGKLHGCGDYTSGNAQYSNWTSGGGWTSPASVIGSRLAVKPGDTTKIFVYFQGGGPSYVSNDGSTFIQYNTFDGDTNTRQNSDIPWLDNTSHDYLSIGDVVHLNLTNYLQFADGVGTWKQPSITVKPLTYTRTSNSLGIDQLIGHSAVCHPTTGDVMFTHEDRTVMAFTRSTVKQNAGRNGVSLNMALCHGGTIDYAADDPSYWAVPFAPDNIPPYSGDWLPQCPMGVSRDRGQTWKPLATHPAGERGGVIAIGNKGTMLYTATFNGKTYWTNNEGASWTELLLSGYSLNNQHNSLSGHRSPIVADKQNPGTFYYYVTGGQTGDARDLAIAGVWRIVIDGSGATATRLRSAYIHGSANENSAWGQLKMPYGKSPHLFYTTSVQNGFFDTPSANMFSMSPDGGINFGLMPALAEVTSFGFGKAAPNATYPAIYAAGFSNASDPLSYGIFGMFDFGFTQVGSTVTTSGTWTLISRLPLNLALYWTEMDGDMGKFGRIYAASPAGSIWLDYTDTAAGT